MNQQENYLDKVVESIKEKVDNFYANKQISNLINKFNNENLTRIELINKKDQKLETLLFEFENESHKEIARIYFNNLFNTELIKLYIF